MAAKKAAVEVAPTASAMVQLLLTGIQKEYGEESVQPMDSDGLSIHIPGVIGTGSEWSDWALGRGGVPLSRITLLSGDEGAGKTTFCLNLVASVQKMGGLAFYIDAEYKLDRDYALALGCDLSQMILSQPGTIEQAFGMIEKACDIAAAARAKTGMHIPTLIILDSYSALPAMSEVDDGKDSKGQDKNPEGKQHPGAQARALGSCLRRVNSKLSKEHVALVLVSQLRTKFGVTFGDDTTTTGGAAPRFWACVIAKLQAGAFVKEGDERAGRLAYLKVEKNQAGPPFRKCQVLVNYGTGIDRIHGLHNAIKYLHPESLAGSWTTFAGMKWQGEAQLRQLCEDDPGNYDDIVAALREPYGWGANNLAKE
jgi:recombination protein RecA